MFQQHRDREIRQGIVEITDRLCSYERNTGIENILVVAEQGYLYVAINGKAVPNDVIRDVTVQGLLKRFVKEE